jgi:hypothetical protein
MLTFNQIYSEVQAQAQDVSAASLIVIKRAINQGMHKFGAILNRDWRDVERTFQTAANQTYYQSPEDAIRIKSITVTVGSVTYPLTEIVDEEVWQDLNRTLTTSSVPTNYYVKGSDQYGIYPTPSAINTGTITFEGNMRDMTADDYSTGTIAVTAASQAVVGTGTTFTAAMVGRTLFVDPVGGTGDGSGYKISAFTDTTHISLENNYAGATASGQSYLLGQVPDIPDEFHESLVDYGCYRYYKRRRDMATAKEMKAAFDEAVILCQQNYSSKTSSQYFRSSQGAPSGYVHQKRDYRVT